MRRSLHDVAREFEVHPLNLFLALAELGAGWADVWPEVDEAWIRTLRDLDGRRIQRPRKEAAAGDQRSGTSEPEAPSVSAEAALIIEKMWRNDRWGSAVVSLESMHRHTHIGGAELKAAVEELVAAGLLVGQHANGPYALDSSRRAEIDAIARWSIEFRQRENRRGVGGA